MIRVLVDVRLHNEGLERLRSISNLSVHVLPFAEESRVLPVDLLMDAEVLFCSFPPANFDVATALRWVQIASSGYSQLFPCRLPDRGIRATNARGCFDVPIAEWNIAMMVSLARDMPQMMRNQQGAIWDRSAQFQREIRGATVGLWGYGGLGRETARLAKAMGMRVHVMTRNCVRPAHDVYRVQGTGDPEGVLPDRCFTAGGEMEFLGGLDFLVLAMPLTGATDGMIGERELSALPKRAFVLNPARGSIIQEQALLRALDEGWIAGAALDTHYKYPMPSDHRLWRYPNVIFTPHISGSTLNPNFTERLWEILLANMARYQRGEPLLNELTAEALRGA